MQTSNKWLLIALILSARAGLASLPTNTHGIYDVDSAFVSTCAGGTVQTPAMFVSTTSEIACVAANLGTLPSSETQFYRYLTLTPAYNNLSNQQFLQLKWSINLALNRISSVGVLQNAVPVGNPAVVMRVDLRNYSSVMGTGSGLSIANWEQLLLPAYPYAISFWNQRQYDLSHRRLQGEIQSLTGSQRAWLRGDWFVEQVEQPPLYYQFLNLPTTETQLTAQLGVTEEQDIENNQAQRAAFMHSGVAHWNRMVDYHPLV